MSDHPSTTRASEFPDVSPVDKKAREFARTAHRDQRYGSGSFFDEHLARVVATLLRFGEDNPTLLAAGWLHDVVEDTPVTIETIRSEFGDEIADLVDRLTDERGGSRRERQHKTHRKIRAVVGAVRIKLADRIANVEACIETQSPLLDRMYRKEYARFREDLYSPGTYRDMWEHLDRLLDTPSSDVDRGSLPIGPLAPPAADRSLRR
jgi:guanosine-3',5'-bis(diphosphate) 3'-pyrophosphohydrolase